MEKIKYPEKTSYISVRDGMIVQEMAAGIYENFNGGYCCHVGDDFTLHQPNIDNLGISFATSGPNDGDLSFISWEPNNLTINDYVPYMKGVRFNMFEVLFEICKFLNVEFSPTKKCIHDCYVNFNSYDNGVTMLDRVKYYFANTPEDEIKKNWDETEKYSDCGPTIDSDFITLKYNRDIVNKNISKEDLFSTLLFASENGFMWLLTHLIEQGVDIHTDNDKALKKAVYNGHLDIIKCLVENGCDIKNCDFKSLYNAANFNNIELIKYLIEHGADANSTAFNKYIAEGGIYSEQYDIILYLIANGANVNYNKDSALKRLTDETRNDKLDRIKFLIKNGANVRVNRDEPLRNAVYNGNLDMVKYLVEQGADIHASADYGLCTAAERGHLDMVKYLVEQGANIHGDYDVLFWAKENGRTEVIEYLKSLN